MKPSLLISFLLMATLSFSQGSTISFWSQGGLPATTDALSNLTLPLKLRFSKDFNGKQILLKNKADQQLINPGQSLGSGELTFHANDPFDYVFETDMKTNPGGYNIPSKEILLSFAGKDFVLRLADGGITGNGGNPGGNTGVTTGNMNKDENYEAGYVYYDVMTLLDVKSDERLKLKILSSYGVNATTIQANPYLNEVFGSLYGRGLPEGGFAGMMGSIGNTDVTYFAAGIARFLAERTKDELNEAFFRKMQEQLNAYPELKTLFPQTSSFLNVIDGYAYASVIQVLKEAFETDVQNLPMNLYQVKNLTEANCDASVLNKNKLSNCQDRLKKLHAFFDSRNGRWIGLGMFTVKEAVQSPNPAGLLKSITGSDELAGIKMFSKDSSYYTNYNIASSIELGNLLSQSLISKDNQQIWITPKELNALLKSQAAVKAYLGLLLAKEQTKNVMIDFYKTDHSPITFGTFLIQQYDTYSSFESQISSLIKNAHAAFNSANNAVKNMMAATDKSVEANPQALYNYYKTVTATLKPVAHSVLLATLTGKQDIGAAYDKIEMYLNPSVDIAYHLATKKYSTAIYDATILLSHLKPSSSQQTQVISAFTKYGILISTVANAQSSDEVKQALEASVLPVGSYSVKRRTNWSMGINSYVGAFWNYTGSANSMQPYGLSAPIGFTISKGFSKSGNAGGLSVNLQILDVGALVNYYLLKGDTASLPNDFNVKLSNIFAPGFNVCYNIPKTPLSLAWGGQYIPTLYKYQQINGQNELVPTNAFRMQVSLLVDIPLYNLKVWDFKK